MTWFFGPGCRVRVSWESAVAGAEWVGREPHLRLLRRAMLQSFSYPPPSLSMPVCTMWPTGTSRSLEKRYCRISNAWSPVDCRVREQSREWAWQHLAGSHGLMSMVVCQKIQLARTQATLLQLFSTARSSREGQLLTLMIHGPLQADYKPETKS